MRIGKVEGMGLTQRTPSKQRYRARVEVSVINGHKKTGRFRPVTGGPVGLVPSSVSDDMTDSVADRTTRAG
ncbi:MAG: hypothetical protein ACON39_07550 [Coraliomargaritaceae bacterium]